MSLSSLRIVHAMASHSLYTGIMRTNMHIGIGVETSKLCRKVGISTEKENKCFRTNVLTSHPLPSRLRPPSPFYTEIVELPQSFPEQPRPATTHKEKWKTAVGTSCLAFHNKSPPPNIKFGRKGRKEARSRGQPHLAERALTLQSSGRRMWAVRRFNSTSTYCDVLVVELGDGFSILNTAGTLGWRWSPSHGMGRTISLLKSFFYALRKSDIAHISWNMFHLS